MPTLDLNHWRSSSIKLTKAIGVLQIFEAKAGDVIESLFRQRIQNMVTPQSLQAGTFTLWNHRFEYHEVEGSKLAFVEYSISPSDAFRLLITSHGV
jgi:hypothetical protein